MKTEPIARLLGVGLKAFYEANPSTMKRFNNAVLDKPNVKVSMIWCSTTQSAPKDCPRSLTSCSESLGIICDTRSRKTFLMRTTEYLGTMKFPGITLLIQGRTFDELRGRPWGNSRHPLILVSSGCLRAVVRKDCRRNPRKIQSVRLPNH